MRTKQKKRILTIIVAVLVLAIALTYVLPLTVLAEEEFGTDDPSVISPTGEEYPTEEEPPPPPELVILDTAVKLDVGQTYTLTYRMENFPEGTMVEWKSGDSSIAAIGADGKLIANSPGSVEIAATAGEKRATVLITVNELKASNIIIVVGEDVEKTGNDTYGIKVGDVVRLTAKIEPEGAKVGKITWVIGDDEVASIAQNGELVAEAKGRTQVTVMADALTKSIWFDIEENGISIDRLINYILIAVIIVIVIVVIAVVVTRQNKKKREAEERRRALAAKRRREEAERKEREGAETAEMQRLMQETRPVQTEDRMTKKINGTAVGAGLGPSESDEPKEPERPITLDDLD